MVAPAGRGTLVPASTAVAVAATPPPLLDALGTYAAFRRVLLQGKHAAACAAGSAYPPHNRFLLSAALLDAAAARDP